MSQCRYCLQSREKTGHAKDCPNYGESFNTMTPVIKRDSGVKKIGRPKLEEAKEI